MKAVFLSLVSIFSITAMVTHIWTVVIAFIEGGFLSGVVSFFIPVLSELYWMVKMFGENDTYAYIALLHLLLAIPFAMLGRDDNR